MVEGVGTIKLKAMADYSQSTDTSIPRGVRNNNPGDIKDDGTAWQGATGSDGTFVIFSDMSWGLRALATDLLNKISKDNLNTIRLIVTKYAPPSENITDSYISAVSGELGISADQVLTADAGTIHSLMRAVIDHEIGEDASQQYVSDADIDGGISMVNSGLQGMIQAAGIAIQSNPTKALIIGGVLLVGLYALAR
jgi:hypothetical protein